MYAHGHGREILAWLLPVALATTNAVTVAATLMDELRRRKIIAPGPCVVERLVAAALVVAERHVAGQLTRNLSPAQTEALDALLGSKEDTSMSVLAWARQPPGAPGHKALKRIVEQLARLRAVGLDPAVADGVHPERLRKLAREGGRFTAQHLRALSPLRRRATLVATVLDTTARLTDDGVGLFDRAVGRMFRRAEAREENAVLRDARAVNDKVRLLAKLGAALIAAKATEGAADLDGAVASAIGWEKLAASVAEAERLAARTKWTCPHWPRAPGRCCTGSARCSSTPSSFAPCPPRRRRCARSSCCTKRIRAAAGNGPRACQSASSVRPGETRCGTAAATGGTEHRRAWEAATLLTLRDQLRAGDIWVEGSRQWRAIEDQLIPPALFAAMREAGPLPVAVPATAEEYLAERRALLDRRMGEIDAKAAADKLEDVRIKDDELKITPLKAITPEEAEAAADGSTP